MREFVARMERELVETVYRGMREVRRREVLGVDNPGPLQSHENDFSFPRDFGAAGFRAHCGGVDGGAF